MINLASTLIAMYGFQIIYQISQVHIDPPLSVHPAACRQIEHVLEPLPPTDRCLCPELLWSQSFCASNWSFSSMEYNNSSSRFLWLLESYHVIHHWIPVEMQTVRQKCFTRSHTMPDDCFNYFSFARVSPPLGHIWDANYQPGGTEILPSACS